MSTGPDRPGYEPRPDRLAGNPGPERPGGDPGGAPTLVLLHPVGLDGGSFALLGLEGAVTPTLLGHRGRPRSPGMTLADVADDVATSVPGPIDVAGFSFGGMVAIQLALRYPGCAP